MIGKKFTAGDNYGGIQNVGEFGHAVSQLKATGHTELAQGLEALRKSILESVQISAEVKREHVEVVDEIAAEAAKPKPNKTKVAGLWGALLGALKVVPDVIEVAGALVPLIKAVLI